MQHLKRILRLSVIQIWNKIRIFFSKVWKKLKEIDFSEIYLKNFVSFWWTRANFWKVFQVMLKITVLPLSQHNFRSSWEFLDF